MLLMGFRARLKVRFSLGPYLKGCVLANDAGVLSRKRLLGDVSAAYFELAPRRGADTVSKTL